MSEGGYVKLWRSMESWPIWQAMSGDQSRVLIIMMWMANWRDGQVFDVAERRFVDVPRGSFVATQEGIAARAQVGRRVVRTTIEMLTADPGDGPFLTTTPTKAGTLFSIVNYARYQGDDTAADQAPDQSPTRARPEPDQRSICKKGKKGKKYSPRARDPQTTSAELELPPEAWSLARQHAELLLKHDPSSPCGGARHSERAWAREYDRGQRETTAEPLRWAEIVEVLTWAIEQSEPWADGSHWRDHLLTPGALFRHWATLRRQMIVAKSGQRSAERERERSRRQLEEQSAARARAAEPPEAFRAMARQLGAGMKPPTTDEKTNAKGA